MTDLDTRQPEFTVAIRGYDRLQVDEYIERLQKLLSEAEERVRTAESGHDFSSHAAIGPRLAEIFDLAGAEAKDLRAGAEREAKKRVADAKAYAKELVTEARATAKSTAEQAATDYKAMLTEYESERERIRAEVTTLDEHRAAILGELRRLHESLGAAFGIVETGREGAPGRAEAAPVREEAPRAEAVIALEGSEMTTVELPRRAGAARKAS